MWGRVGMGPGCRDGSWYCWGWKVEGVGNPLGVTVGMGPPPWGHHGDGGVGVGHQMDGDPSSDTTGMGTPSGGHQIDGDPSWGYDVDGDPFSATTGMGTPFRGHHGDGDPP